MSDKKKQADQDPVGRRAFFRHILLAGLDRVERVGEAVERRLASVSPQESEPTVPLDHGAGRYLRPPGAIPDPAFEQACSRCGDCVRACPAKCIQIDPAAAGGMPYIVPRFSPCVVCEDLSCMKACPTDALVLVDEASHINMGLAVVDHGRCLRSGGTSGGEPQDCRLCIKDCPLGDGAIQIGADSQVAVLTGCVGCGVCERVCPTEPASIQINPRQAIQ